MNLTHNIPQNPHQGLPVWKKTMTPQQWNANLTFTLKIITLIFSHVLDLELTIYIYAFSK